MRRIALIVFTGVVSGMFAIGCWGIMNAVIWAVSQP